MTNVKSKLALTLFLAVLKCFLASPLFSEEKIIQKENMSFERCLTVIEVSGDKLLLTPEVSNIDDKKREAVFKMADGYLKITCDGEKGLVIVSTKMD